MNQEDIRYAGFWLRFFAAVLDSLVLLTGQLVFFGLLFLMVYAILNLFDAEETLRLLVYYILGGILALISFWITWIYHAKMESSRFQGTLGKMALGIQVCDRNLQPVTFDRATARHFAKIITNWTLGVGWLMAAFAHRKQALHDHIAGTVLVLKRHRY